MKHNVWLYILFMFLATYAVRILPLTLIRRPITNRFVKSFLYYVPYVSLAVMTFPAILTASGSVWAGAAALAALAQSVQDVASRPVKVYVGEKEIITALADGMRSEINTINRSRALGVGK